MRKLGGANSTLGAVILMSSVANVADGGVEDCCWWMLSMRTLARADGESSADAVRTGGGVDASGLLLSPAPLEAMVEGLAVLRTGEERVGDRARVAAAAADVNGREGKLEGEGKKLQMGIQNSSLGEEVQKKKRRKKLKHDGSRRQGLAPVVVPRVRGDAREAPHQGGHAR